MRSVYSFTELLAVVETIVITVCHNLMGESAGYSKRADLAMVSLDEGYGHFEISF